MVTICTFLIVNNGSLPNAGSQTCRQPNNQRELLEVIMFKTSPSDTIPLILQTANTNILNVIEKIILLQMTVRGQRWSSPVVKMICLLTLDVLSWQCN